jgi:hypothetical protein
VTFLEYEKPGNWEQNVSSVRHGRASCQSKTFITQPENEEKIVFEHLPENHKSKSVLSSLST